MESRISAVRFALWQLLILAALCALVTLPAPGNRVYLRSLREAQAFAQTFRREEAEAKLLAQARTQGAQPLRALLPAPADARGARLSVLDDALPIAPVTGLALDSLDVIRSFAEGVPPAQKTLTIGVPDVSQVGASLGWRIARMGVPQPVVLESARVVPADVGAEDVTREGEVARHLTDSVEADRAAEEAQKKLTQAEAIVESRKERRMPWKAIQKAREAAAEARSAYDRKAAAAELAKGNYEALVARALAQHAPKDAPVVPGFALLRVNARAGEAPIVFEVPVLIAARSVPVSPLSGAAFSELVQAGLWNEVAASAPAAAPSAVARHFNWHMRELAPGLSGALLLQLVPCLLPVLLAWLLGRIRALEVSYSPFSTQVRSTGLPRPGFKQRWLELVAVVLLPIGVCALSAASLVLIGQAPTLPVLCAGLCFFLGLRAFGKLAELTEMVDSVVQSHSYPPAV